MAPETSGIINTEPNLSAPDDFYELLIDTHRGLSLEESQLVNAKLILLLANHIGDLAVLRQAFARAREGVGAGGGGDRKAPGEQREKER